MFYVRVKERQRCVKERVPITFATYPNYLPAHIWRTMLVTKTKWNLTELWRKSVRWDRRTASRNHECIRRVSVFINLDCRILFPVCSEQRGPVGTNYSRVIPAKEINSKDRDNFWKREEEEERRRVELEKQRQLNDVEKSEQVSCHELARWIRSNILLCLSLGTKSTWREGTWC